MIGAGRYKGHLLHWKVDKSKNGAIQFVVEAELTQKQVDKKYQPFTNESGTTITGFLVLVTANGDINQRQVDNLKDALVWNGVSLKDLNDADYTGKELNFTTSVSEEGKSYIDWINGAGIFIKPSAEKLSEFDSAFLTARGRVDKTDKNAPQTVKPW